MRCVVIIASQRKSPSADWIEGLLVTTAGVDTSEGGMGLAAAGNYTDRPAILTVPICWETSCTDRPAILTVQLYWQTSYTDSPAILTDQLYWQSSYTDRPAILTDHSSCLILQKLFYVKIQLTLIHVITTVFTLMH